jgi:hypothetical protein
LAGFATGKSKNWLCFFPGKRVLIQHIVLLKKKLRKSNHFKIGFVFSKKVGL